LSGAVREEKEKYNAETQRALRLRREANQGSWLECQRYT